ncbi:MAG: type II secretion system protein [Gemmatimonadales bacterium]
MSSISIRLNRRGATLPLTVIVLALMAVSVAITYGRISAERVITGDAQAQAGAFAVAQSGLNRYLSAVNGKPAASVTVNYTDLPGGTAQVDLRMLRESTTTLLPAVYVITSRGRYTAARRYNSLTPSAERTVATYALWQPAPFDLNAGVTSLTGMTANGNSGAYSGIDRCGAGASIPGVAVPDGTWNAAHPTIVDGVPDDAAVGMGSGGLGGTAKDEVKVDWAGVVAGTAFPANYTYPTNAWPGTGSPGFADWPVVRVNGDLTMPGSGKGILIVTGNLTWNGTPNKQWEGLVLVGGTLIGNGASTIYGAVITGLNIKTGTAVGNYDVGNGTKTWQYDSCSLTRALGHIGSLQRVRNGWTDTWSSY